MLLEEQPRYRLNRRGPGALSNAELLALILGSSVVRIGEIFRPAIEAPAAAIILAHNV